MYRQFGALRGLAIVLVVLNHSVKSVTWVPQESAQSLAAGGESLFLSILVELGVLAVPIFLFISGGFFAYAASGSRSKLSWKPVKSSLKQVLWPYLVWSVVFYALVYLWKGEQYSVVGYATKLIVGYPFNFVPLLVFWYIASPLLVRISDRFGWAFIAILAVYQLILLNLVFPGAFGFEFPSWMNALVPKVIGFTMAKWAIFFPLGLICGLKARTVNPLLTRFSTVLLAVCALTITLSLLSTRGVLQAPLAGTFAAVSFVLFALTLKRDADNDQRPCASPVRLRGIAVPDPVHCRAGDTDCGHGRGGALATAAHVSIPVRIRRDDNLNSHSTSAQTVAEVSAYSGALGGGSAARRQLCDRLWSTR